MMRRNARMKRDVFLADIDTRPLIMGILNVTPDSFFDGGRYIAGGATLARVRQMVVDGCDIVDIGAESTRPEAQAIDEAEELTRLDRVLEEIATLDVPVSIDTTKSAVAARALSVGAVLVNDVWGLQKDPRMADIVAEVKAAVVIMHNRAEMRGAQRAARAKRRKPNSFHLRQSVSCFSSMVKIAPSLTSISRTMHMRPVLSMSLTS
jgi:dihydropteroate synthase